ncbi:hypothetical protein OG404_09080 [Streptomyces griseoaurantiacus]|uniref:tetratricopeptide repeat protein n=1 Tax=Streptomyces griseoaurantiacus TaxID=68213 RepID=UPI00352C7152
MIESTDLSTEREILRSELRKLEASALQGRDRTDAIAEASRRLQQALSPTTVGGWFEKGIPAKDFKTLWTLVEVLLEWSGLPRPDTLTGLDRAKATGQWVSTKELWKRRWEQARAAQSVAALPPGFRAENRYVGRPIAEFDDRLVLNDLEVHPALDGGSAVGRISALPAYVRREFDTRLGSLVAAAANGQSGIVVLVGGSSTGKTRACWEAVKNLPDGWRLWHPIEPDQPTAVIRNLDLVAPRTVVWLNDAQHYLLDRDHSAQVASGLRELLNDPERGPVLILGTTWPEHWDRLTDVPRTEPVPPDPSVQARQLVTNKSITVPAAFTVEELTTAQATTCDPRLAEALQHAEQGQVTQYLAGVPALIERYNNASPGAKALIEAAMDVRSLGHGLALPLALLEAAAEGYLTETQWDLLEDDWLEQALAYVACPVRGTRGPLTRIRPRRGQPAFAQPHYRLADYLEQHGRHSGTVPPVPGARDALVVPVPAHTWDVLVDHSTPSGRASLARAAHARGLLRIAMRLYQGAVEAGDTRALRPAADVLRMADREEEAIAWYQRGAEAGDLLALGWAVLLLTRLGMTDEALTCHRLASEAGDSAPLGMNALLEKMQQIEDADAWVQRNVVDGARVTTQWAPLMLRDDYAWLLQRPTRIAEALERLRTHAEAGNTGSLTLVTDLLHAAGRVDEARRLRRYGWEPKGWIAEPWEAPPPGD